MSNDCPRCSAFRATLDGMANGAAGRSPDNKLMLTLVDIFSSVFENPSEWGDDKCPPITAWRKHSKNPVGRPRKLV